MAFRRAGLRYSKNQNVTGGKKRTNLKKKSESENSVERNWGQTKRWGWSDKEKEAQANKTKTRRLRGFTLVGEKKEQVGGGDDFHAGAGSGIGGKNGWGSPWNWYDGATKKGQKGGKKKSQYAEQGKNGKRSVSSQG